MSRKRLRPRLETPLPLPEAGWFRVAHSITARGELACLQSTMDMRAAWRGRHVAEILPRAPGRLFILGGGAESAHAQFELEVPYPVFDRLPDGRWIISNSRCCAGEENARLLAPDGALIRGMCLGDGIGHLQCDTGGDVWVGYFDEGIFGNYGWGNADGPPPIGESGLAKLSTAGDMIWRYDGEASGMWIDDCYALNVTDDAWACFYSDFPILRIGEAGQARLWGNKVAGARAIAVDAPHVVLAGGYGDDRARLALLRLEAEGAPLLFEAELDLGVSDVTEELLQARGDQVHIVNARAWLRLTVADIVREAGLGIAQAAR